MLCHTTIWPAGSVAGFGEKDCAPLIPTTLMVTTPPGAGAGVGAGVGVGVGAAVVGGVGVTGLLVESPVQPAAPRLTATIMLATNTRILIPFLLSRFTKTDGAIVRPGFFIVNEAITQAG
jgi:hypothetical protein